MRVLYVINGLGTGGAERSLADLLDPLARRDFDISIAYLEQRAVGVQMEVERSNSTHYLGDSLVRATRELRRLIGELEPDLIHTTIFESDLTGRFGAFATGVPVLTSFVNTSYDVDAGRNPDVSPVKLRLVRELDGFTARHLNDSYHSLTTVTARAAGRALRLPIDQIHVVPRGRPRSRLGRWSEERRLKQRQILGIDPDATLLLNVGRQEHQKGQLLAIHAMSALVKRDPKTSLLIVGREGTATPRLLRAVEDLGLGDRIRMVGHSPYVPDLMTAADALMFPSLYEGFGGTLVEAMALRLPILASDIPVHREVCEGTALLFTRDSPLAIAEAVETLSRDPDLAEQLRDRGAVRFDERYEMEVVAEQMASMYKQVLA